MDDEDFRLPPDPKLMLHDVVTLFCNRNVIENEFYKKKMEIVLNISSYSEISVGKLLTSNSNGTAMLLDSMKQVSFFAGLIRLISQPIELINRHPGNKSNKILQDSFWLGEHLNIGAG